MANGWVGNLDFDMILSCMDRIRLMSIWPWFTVIIFSSALLAEDAATKTSPALGSTSRRITALPDYVHSIPDEPQWLDFGLESRLRYEHRWHDYNSPEQLTDDALVTRNLLCLGVKEVLDPVRFILELEDSRRFLSSRPDNPNVETGFEFLQALMQFHFEDAAFIKPLVIGVGRMAFDWTDRRLIVRSRNRNTISAFDGVRLHLGDERALWELDAIAVRPVKREVAELDASSDNSLLAGVAGSWRGWSPHVILEPYWLWFEQKEKQGKDLPREFHTFGLHVLGQLGGQSAWDYDLSLAGQWGETAEQEHRAWAAHAELGHTFENRWKPRIAAWFNYASGDRNANDTRNQRFDPLFGATFAFYGFSGYFSWQNLVNPALRLSLQPAKSVKLEMVHRAFWLASETDAWVRAQRRDRSGASGSYLGQETDLRLVWQLHERFELDVAYAHFWPGNFVRRTGPAPQSDFIQIAGTLRF